MGIDRFVYLAIHIPSDNVHTQIMRASEPSELTGSHFDPSDSPSTGLFLFAQTSFQKIEYILPSQSIKSNQIRAA